MELTDQEVDAALSDKTSLLFDKFYHKQDREVMAAVERNYANRYKGETTLQGGGEIPSHINEAMNREMGLAETAPHSSAPATALTASTQPSGQSVPAEGSPVQYSDEWNYSPEQAQESLKAEWPYWHSENMAEMQKPENFAGLFGDFLKTEADKRFLGELFQQIGNHPRGLKLYHYLITKLKGQRS